MPENTDHPAQKPEKLIAKLILASCPENGMMLDPFLGSITTPVVAKNQTDFIMAQELKTLTVFLAWIFVYANFATPRHGAFSPCGFEYPPTPLN
jgi:hypothetical protein